MSRVRDIASILTASSSMATDAEVSAVSAQIPSYVVGKNFVINGNFDFWQRGTSFAAAGAATTSTYTADRWNSGASNNITISRVSASTEGSTYALRLQRNSSTTTGGDAFICHTIESNNAIILAGKTVTLSFNVRSGANFSGAAAYCVPRFGTGLDEGSLAGYNGQWTGYSQIINTVTPTTTMTRYEKTFTVPSGTKQIMLLMGVQSFTSSAAGANDWIEFEKIQLEVGSVATAFSRAGGDLQSELAKCQRYFYRIPFSGNQGISFTFAGNGTMGTSFQFPVHMRANPTGYTTINSFTTSGSPTATQVYLNAFYVGNLSGTYSSATLSSGTAYSGGLNLYSWTSPTVGLPYGVGGGSGCYVDWSAEL
jgi:hypothetical protein